MLHAVVFALGLAPVPVASPEKVQITTPPPRLVVVDSVDREKQVVTIQVFRLIPYTQIKKVPVNVGGKIQFREVPETVYKAGTRTVAYSLRDTRVLNTNGKVVLALDAAQRLRAGNTVVLAEAGSERVDPAYLKALKEDTLILLPPPEVARSGEKSW